jgi:hypothetical protein
MGQVTAAGGHQPRQRIPPCPVTPAARHSQHVGPGGHVGEREATLDRHQPSPSDAVLGGLAAASRPRSDVPAPWQWHCPRCQENAVAALPPLTARRRSHRPRGGRQRQLRSRHTCLEGGELVDQRQAAYRSCVYNCRISLRPGSRNTPSDCPYVTARVVRLTVSVARQLMPQKDA